VRHWSPGDGGFRLEIPDLTIAAGERIGVLGVSGSGKSTLLDLLGLVLSPTAAARFRFSVPGGEPLDVAAAWAARAQDRLGAARARHIGYVLQTGALLPFLSVAENILLSPRLLGQEVPAWGKWRAEALAERLGIARHLAKRPDQLSVGERQRVAIARALAHRPSVVIADEPTAALDPETAARIMDLLLAIAAEDGTTMIVASHDWAGMRALGLRVLTPRVEGMTAVLEG